MTDRRSFLHLSALAAAAGCVLRSNPAFAFAGPGEMRYGLQLYMVRRQIPADLPGVLKAIRQVGCTEVELFPDVYNHSPAELKKIVADAGLTAPSGHFEYASLEDKVDYAHALGLKFMVCPAVPKEQWGSLAGFQQAAAKFNRVGEKCRAAGMEFCFHNHCYEFRPMDGTTGFDELMKHSDPNLVKLEFDIFWLAQAGQDPMAMIKKHSNRLRLVHMKDRIAGSPIGYDMEAAKGFTELGKGSLNWPALLAQAKSQGVRHAFLDQDETSGPVMESLRENFDYLKTVKV